MTRFTVTGEGLGGDALIAEIERRAGKELGGAPVEAEIPRTPTARDLFGELLRALASDADASRGFPPQSHRSFGSAVVAAKKGFRLAFQPLINDALSRQTTFNNRLLDALAALHAEQQALAARIERLEKGRGERPARARRARAT
ncbi:MAG: hypothetical protein ACYDCL_10595 [Myxococcales bacterium]